VSRITVLEPVCSYGGGQRAAPLALRMTTSVMDAVCRYIDPDGDGFQITFPPPVTTG
jgi:hypothetical protein